MALLMTLVAVVATTAALLIAWTLVSRSVQLWSIPGPVLAKFTDYWLFKKFRSGHSWKQLSSQLHERYGPIVRYGPRRVMFSSADAIPAVFSTSRVLEKADSYNPMIVIQGGREVSSLITLRPETRHSATLRVLRPILTKSAVLELEDVIDGTIATLSAELKQVWPILNINEWLSFFALDTVFRISFGQDLGCMRHKTDVDGVLAGAKGRFKHWHDWLAMPWLEGLWFRNRFFPAAQRQTELSRLITKRIALQKMRIGERSALLDKILPLHEAHPDIITEAAVSGISVSLIHAGAETIAMTMTAVIYNLAKNPAALEKLLEELRTNGVTTASKFAELDKLPYLEAVIKESMRLIPTTNDMLERVVPVGGVDIAGIFVPSGTTVSVSHHALYRNPHVFGPDVDEYNPDRWLQVDTKQRQAMERASLHWGGGKRICTGQHIAWLEMKKLLAHLVQTFEVDLINPDEKDLVVYDQFFASFKKLRVHIKER